MLCFLFSSYLSAQSFEKHPNVFISNEAIVTELPSPQTRTDKQKIYVVKGTTITGFADEEITYLSQKQNKKQSHQQISPEKSKRSTVKQKIYEKENQKLVLKATNSGKSYLVNISLKDVATANPSNSFTKHILSYETIRQPFYGYKLTIPTHNKTNTFKTLLSKGAFSVRPPPGI